MQSKWFKLAFLFTCSSLIVASANAGDDGRITSAVKLSASINKENQRGEIRWYALPEKNKMLRFEVQKSVDGSLFSYLTSVAGDRRNNLKQYFAEDRNLLEGNNFYRLKIIYEDGAERFTPAIQMASSGPVVTILPVVAEEKLYIWLPENAHISNASVTDISGKIILENSVMTTAAGVVNIDVKKLTPGFYNLIVQLSPSEKKHLKFSKK